MEQLFRPASAPTDRLVLYFNGWAPSPIAVEHLGPPEGRWAWAEEKASSVGAAVNSSASMRYGSLVGSRKHDYTRGEVMARLKNFEEFRAAHPALPLYVFGSIMRTPRSGEASGSEEPGYYTN